MQGYPTPTAVRLRGRLYRIVATRYPPVDLFERHVPPELLGPLWALEAQTNPRLLDETGDLLRVSPEDRVSGPGASIVMAAFTHVGRPSRFSDGSYGVYYASRSLETAIRETVHHRELVARDAALGPEDLSMRAWVGHPRKSLHDLRGQGFEDLHDPAPRPEDHPRAQAYGRHMREARAWGLVYRSVRHPGGQCVAALRPPAVSLPVQGSHLVYVWDGERIVQVYERSEPLLVFD